MSELQSFNLDIQDYAVAAGGYLELGKPADFFQIMEAAGPVDVTFLHSESSVGMARGVGQGFRLGPLQNRFYGVKIYSASAQTLKLCFSSGKSPVDLSQVVSVTGTVSVISGEMERVRSGVAFSQTGYCPAVAGQYSHVQLFNPAGSGKNIFLNKVTAMSAVVSIVSFRPYDTPISATINYGLSKKLGGTQSVGQVLASTNAAILGTDSIMLVGFDAANKSGEIPFSEPIMITPGKGILAIANTVNGPLWSSMQWIEETI